MATWAYDACDVNGTSSLYIETCWQNSFICAYLHRYINKYICIQGFPY